MPNHWFAKALARAVFSFNLEFVPVSDALFRSKRFDLNTCGWAPSSIVFVFAASHNRAEPEFFIYFMVFQSMLLFLPKHRHPCAATLQYIHFIWSELNIPLFDVIQSQCTTLVWLVFNDMANRKLYFKKIKRSSAYLNYDSAIEMIS